MTHTSLFALAFSTSRFNFFFGAMSSGNPYVSSNKNWMNQQAFHSIPMQPSAGVSSEGMASSESKPVKGEVVDINVGSKRFKLIPEPFMEDYPGAGGNPYPTADIRRSMMQPSCSVKSADPRHGVGEHMVLYGYFWNKTENQQNWFKAQGVGKSEVPPSGQNYISLRGSVLECLDRSTWGRDHKTYYMDRNLLFYRLRIPKESYQYLMGHKIIEEKGKYENGKQWVHLHKTNVKSRATLTTPDKREILMWTGELLSKDDMEALAWQIDPQWDYPAHYVKGARIVCSHIDESAPFDLSAHSAPAGIWSR